MRGDSRAQRENDAQQKAHEEADQQNRGWAEREVRTLGKRGRIERDRLNHSSYLLASRLSIERASRIGIPAHRARAFLPGKTTYTA